MNEQFDSSDLTPGSELPAPAHLNSVASTPPNMDLHTPLDCSVRLQDILASPSPICKRTRMQLRLRQTAVLQVSLDPTDQEGPLDLSPNRPIPNDPSDFQVPQSPASLASPSDVELAQRQRNEDYLLDHTPSDSVICIGSIPPLRQTEIQHTPEDVIEIIRNLSITESPLNLFPVTSIKEVPDITHDDKKECDLEIEKRRESQLDPVSTCGKSHPAIRIENVSSPVRIQQVEYFPFSLRCAFCDLNLSSPSSFAEHVLEIHSGFPATQFSSIQQQVNGECCPNGEKNDSPASSPGDSEKDSPHFKCDKCKEVHATEAAFLQHICSPSPSRAWACVLCEFVAKKRRGLRFHMKEKHNTWKVRVNENGLPVANLTPAVPRIPKARSIKFQSPNDELSTLRKDEAGESSTSRSQNVKHPTSDAKVSNEVDGHKLVAIKAQKDSCHIPLDLCPREPQVRCSKCTFVATSELALEKHCGDSHSPVLSTPYDVELPDSPEDVPCPRNNPSSAKDSCLALTPYCQSCPICGTLCRSSEELLSHDCGAIGGEISTSCSSPNRKTVPFVGL
ncbi:hypothetical protein AVEN_50701-1 [Araneus ventricosus]|uniref:C2H2-type domain-containing protein n=1 Tax=Araneus ventricosus TaxID=182803 RepID=A0A4Y2SHR2_ARAVE|nr:hypothetical protein AVEN_50701-1 [Araneus ventricosus]